MDEISTVKITQKGQVTIPTSMRRKHGLTPEVEVELLDHPNGVLVMKAVKGSRGKQILQTLMRGGPIEGSTSDLLRLTRGAK